MFLIFLLDFGSTVFQFSGDYQLRAIYYRNTCNKSD